VPGIIPNAKNHEFALTVFSPSKKKPTVIAVGVGGIDSFLARLIEQVSCQPAFFNTP
jgi:hypothetical protein